MLDRSFGEPVRPARLAAAAASSTTFAKEKLKEYDVRAPGITTHAGNLSGGNQQKVVVARELSRDLRLLVAAQPTRGVDVGSIEFIHKQIVGHPRLRRARCWSSPPSSTRSSRWPTGSWCSTAAQIVGIVPADTPREVLGLMMTGERPDGGAWR